MTNSDAPFMQFRLQFGLKALLIALTAVGVWLGLQVNGARWQREAVERIKSLRGSAMYDHQVSGEIVTKRGAAGGKAVGLRVTPTRARRPAREWLEQFFGVDLFADVVYVDLSATAVVDLDLARLHGLPRLRFLSLANTHVTDGGLQSLVGLTRIERLDLSGTQATDAGLPLLAKLANLVELRLGSTMSTLGRLDQATLVTDAGLRHLRPLKRLKRLDLSGTQISDAGLKHLLALESLEYLDLRDTRTTAAGRGALQAARPDLEISGDELELAARQ
jgi:Leucine-rich repeat (LRR) protein